MAFSALGTLRNHPAWCIALLALALRLAVFSFILLRFGDAGFILPPFSDGHGYVTIAQNLLAGRGYSLDEQAPYHPDIKRVPIYTTFLAATFFLSGGALWLAAFLQACISAATAALIYSMTNAIAGRRAAFAAGALAAVYPFAVFLSTQILADTMFACALCLACALFLYALSSQSARMFIAAGCAMGAAALVKPAAQYIPALFVPSIAMSAASWRRISLPAIFIAAFLLVISPWLVRNERISGIATLSYEANILFDLHLAGYTAYKETGSAANADKYRTVNGQDALVAASRGAFVRRIAAAFLSDPVGFSKYLAISTVPFVFGDGFVTMVDAVSPGSVPAWNFSASGSALGRTIGFGVLPPGLLLLSIASKALWAAVLVCAAVGFIRLLLSGSQKSALALAIALVVAYFMFAGGPVQSARYRAPVEPLIFMLAGIGAAAISRGPLHMRQRRSFPPQAN